MVRASGSPWSVEETEAEESVALPDAAMAGPVCEAVEPGLDATPGFSVCMSWVRAFVIGSV